jgi:hypothetical protein
MAAAETPAILALDFDGVLCEGRGEMFETSSRTYSHFWSPSTLKARTIKSGFWRLRTTIKSGWEMPILVRALALGVSEARITRAWTAVREEVLGTVAVPRDELVRRVVTVFDTVRRDWIWIDHDSWLDLNRPYVPLDTLRRVVAAQRTAVVTTKEGEFARLILGRWNVSVDAIEGKEAGEHKCENLVRLMEQHAAAHGGEPPIVWFVEDRLETLEHVKECSKTDPRLERVGLFLAEWGYTTPAAKRAARRDSRIQLLTLRQFARGVEHWLS